MEGPRQRRAVNYAQQDEDSARKPPKKGSKRSSAGGESDYSGGGGSANSSEGEWELMDGEDDGRGRKRGRPFGSGTDAAGMRKWSVREGHMLLDGVLAFGGQRWQDVQRHCSLSSRPTRDIQEAGEAMAKIVTAAPIVVEAALHTLASREVPTQPQHKGDEGKPEQSSSGTEPNYAMAAYQGALAVYKEVCSMGPVESLSVKERKEREEQAREVAMKAAITEMKVVPDPICDYAVRSDTLKKLSKDAVMNKQKLQFSRAIFERVNNAKDQEEQQQQQQQQQEDRASVPPEGPGEASTQPGSTATPADVKAEEEQEGGKSEAGGAAGQVGTSGPSSSEPATPAAAEAQGAKGNKRETKERKPSGAEDGCQQAQQQQHSSALAQALPLEAKAAQVASLQGKAAPAVGPASGQAARVVCASRPVRKEKSLPPW
ncbi:hypothetical protein DUNSADRAFT_9789 [Dunaliella salina]|uniref:Uncharacterized protein n=1 Tax=Dunaliella salina TaxID=3046 RepID=A0ABQ7GGM9_DUNSA|nr:hypothetical protein DUNSADRAFT_9789 [Dunaliella salina]|eukprot:KAF5833765.1 hypothetical protein DUNSADRAFT_9789 [Dunaliella salina]